jgi:hypothetical protein
MLRCEHSRLSHSADGGRSWRLLPMHQTLWGRILSHFILEWPPIPIAMGWRNGKIAVVHADFHEDGSPNGRYISSFEERKGRWSTRQCGLVPDGDKSDHWWIKARFEIVVCVRPAPDGLRDAI